MERRSFLKALAGVPVIGKAFAEVPGIRPDTITEYTQVMDPVVRDLVTEEPICVVGRTDGLHDIIYDIAPHETPLSTGIACSATGEWVTDEMKPWEG